ncbi:hypothetical protein [Gimesia maris]|uniref:Uncharacterized protein n=1 Tax=Gimesia maris TaxID=122 RepID=A0A3D3RIX6_9PLAN|nr:hypothetical protein [Gimesia maris]MAC54677.1 hypothetical protein [Gimesia sp.]HAW26966.1 hypothetical protein [Planctomycetaceae bacterium]EDL57681.1 hypothetical protein PM8797T_31850 [Gimesia maris DSM 8797]QDT79123.1 hypothetical protein Mal35_25770 [Gimesia maris]QDU14662.1 hypothetical protein CA11_24710 [Gimesia maris]
MPERFCQFCVTTGVLLASAGTVLAQEETRQSGLVETSQTSVVEYILVAVLVGLALFAICRTSHRS